MPYSTATPPIIATQPFSNTAPQVWTYSSADSHATIDGASYIADGKELGMRVGDLVIAWSTGDGDGKIHRVASVAAPADARSPGAGPYAATLES